MSGSGMRIRPTRVALILCAVLASGCADLMVPRIDPTGEQVFVDPTAAGVAPYASTPRAPMPWDAMQVVLTPQVTVAPIGSEVVLLAGVLGRDNFLRTNRQLEWSLAPGGVGHFVAVGKNGLPDLLRCDFSRPRKVDNTFAIGSTSRDYLRLDRGTPTTEDDVCVLAGQGWITLSSPIEGTSHVAVYAPEVRAWDKRLQTATVHWVDAQWSFPPPAINPAGTTHLFTTTVIRQSDRAPCVGWLVRYEITGGPPAGFAPEGVQSIEVPTDALGQAGVEIFQQQAGPGTNQIAIQVIRTAAPGGPYAYAQNGKRLVVGSGGTLKTWTAPALAVRKTAPAVADVGATITYRIEVSNPGDMPAEEVTLVDELPEAFLRYLDSTPAAEVTGRTLQWRLGRIGAGQSLSIELNCSARQAGSVTNSVAATAVGGLKASDSAATTVTTPTVDVKLSGPTQATVGSEVTFRALVTNSSPTPLEGLLIKDHFDSGLENALGPGPIERELGNLQPGESVQIDATFRVAKAGRLCNRVEVTGPGSDSSTYVLGRAEACVTAVEAAAVETAAEPGPPAVAAPLKVSKRVVGGESAPGGVNVYTVGDTVRFVIEVTNTGDQTLTNLQLHDYYDASLYPRDATPGFERTGKDLIYTIASLPAGQTETLEVLCECLEPAVRAYNRAVVVTLDGAQQEDAAAVEIRAARAVPGPGGLTMTVSDLNDPVAAGTELTYEILVTNRDPTPHRQLTVVATVPAGMLPVQLGTSGPGRWKIDGQQVRFDAVPQIRPGETLTYRLRVRTREPGPMVFHAEMTAEGLLEAVIREETTEVFQ